MQVLGFYPLSPEASYLEVPASCVQSVTGGHAWSFAEHPVLAGKPKREFVGAEPPPLRVVLDLHAELGVDPAAVRRALVAFGDAGQALEVSASSGRMYGLCVVESCVEAETADEIDHARPLSLRLTVTLADAGEDDWLAVYGDPAPIALERNAGDVTAAPKVIEPSGDPLTVTPEEIARR